MKNIQKKWLAGLGIAIFLNLISPVVSYAMETDKQRKELHKLFFKKLPVDIQQNIARTMSRDALEFLSERFNPRVDSIIEMKEEGIASMAMGNDIIAIGRPDGALMTVDMIYEKETIQDISKKQLKITNEIGVKRHTGSIISIAISGDLVVTGSNDNTVRVWDSKKLKSIATFQFGDDDTTDGVTSVAIQGNIVVCGSPTGFVRIIDLKEMKVLHNFQAHNGPITSMAIDGNLLVTASNDSTAKVWHIPSGQQIRSLIPTDNVTSVAIKNNIAVLGLKNGNISIMDILSAEQKAFFPGHPGSSITSVAIGGNIIITGAVDGTMGIWDIQRLQEAFVQPLFVQKMSDSAILSVAVSGNYMAIANNNRVRILSLETNLQGTEQNNPFLWIIQNANIPQLDLIKRAYEATYGGQEFIISFPSEDATVFLSFPKHVQGYLANSLNIRR